MEVPSSFCASLGCQSSNGSPAPCSCPVLSSRPTPQVQSVPHNRASTLTRMRRRIKEGRTKTVLSHVRPSFALAWPHVFCKATERQCIAKDARVALRVATIGRILRYDDSMAGIHAAGGVEPMSVNGQRLLHLLCMAGRVGQGRSSNSIIGDCRLVRRRGDFKGPLRACF
jgi:hypothetical protein